MGVIVITGRSGSGKSRFITERMKYIIKDPFQKVLVIVPGQLTFETEKDIIESCGVAGIFGLEVLSLQRLAMKILGESQIPDFITSGEKAVICGLALKSSDVALGADIPELESGVAELISRLKAFGHTPQSLLLASQKTSDAALATKLKDISALFARYNELCPLPDASDMYAMAAACADKAQFLNGAYVFIDGLDDCSPAVLGMLTEVMRRARETYTTFRSEENGSDASLFSTERRDMLRFIEAARKSGNTVSQQSAGLARRYSSSEIAFLEENLYKYPYRPFADTPKDIRLFCAESLQQEVDMLASGILSVVKKGCRFRDIAVVGGGIASYLPAIKTKFAECGIPFFFDERRSLAENEFFEFLHSVLSAASGDFSATEKYVYSAYSPLSLTERTQLKKYAKKYSLRGWRFFYPFRLGESEDSELLRQKAMEPLSLLSREIKGNAQDQINSLLHFLELCRTREKHEEFCAAIDEQSTRSEHLYFTQIYDRSLEMLQGIGRICGGIAISSKELCGLIKTGFAATKIAVIPPTTDEVSLFDISVARLPRVEALFAIGLHDGVWPAKDDGAGLLSSAERDALFESGFDIGTYDPAEEKLKTYTALAKPKHALYISHNSQTGQPSVLVDRIRRLFPGLVSEKQTEYSSLNGSRARLLGDMAAILSGAPSSRETLSACSALLKQPGWTDKASRMLLRANGAEGVEEYAPALYGSLRCSATRIEDYYGCPFRHFLDYGVKAQPEREYVGDRLDTGTYMHLALDMFTKALLSDRKDIKTLSSTETEKRMREAAAQAAVLHDNGKLLSDERFALQYSVLTEDLINAALRIREHFSGSCASILSSEQEFKDFTVATRFGDVAISGKIDRIDEADGYFRVVDYKSSSPKFSLREFEGGVSIQLPVYIAAARELLKKAGKDLKPSGGYYMRIGDRQGEDAEDVAKASRLSGISLRDEKALCEFSAVLDDGNFAAIDQKLKKSGELSDSSKGRLFAKDEMESLLERLRFIIVQAAEGIYGGNTAINPAATGNGGECAYCDYGGICLMNEEYAGNEYRQLPCADGGEDSDEQVE